MFEGHGQEARQYYVWHIRVERGIVVEKRSDKPRFAPTMRHGKTERDHERGAWARRWENHEKRKGWDREITAKGPKGKRHFPIEICNGQESQPLKRVHRCVGAGIPGKKGGGPCRHRKGKRA